MIEPISASPFWPLAVYTVAVILLVAVMISFSSVLGERHRERHRDRPYESGATATGSARVRFHIQFYLIAMFFVIFDLEAVYVYAWAVSLRETGWFAYGEMLLFIGVLAAGLVYLWRVKALDWRTEKRRQPESG